MCGHSFGQLSLSSALWLASLEEIHSYGKSFFQKQATVAHGEVWPLGE